MLLPIVARETVLQSDKFVSRQKFASPSAFLELFGEISGILFRDRALNTSIQYLSDILFRIDYIEKRFIKEYKFFSEI